MRLSVGIRYPLEMRARKRTEAPGCAVHIDGLEVRFDRNGLRAVNADEVRAALARVHGPHNAPVMLARLLKEARTLYAPLPPYSGK